MAKKTDVLRLPAEKLYEAEIKALINDDKDDVPAGWQMSPRSVLKFIVGGKAKGIDNTKICRA